MSKKLKGNGLFESSRMMLPEHKEAYLLHQHQLKRRDRPLLDGQEIEQFSQLIAESMLTGKEIMITVYDEYEDKRITGKVIKIDQLVGKIKMMNGIDQEWICFKDIVNVVER